MALIRQQIEIQLSKIKLLLMLVGSLTFVALGLWLVINPPANQNYHRYSPTTILIAGYASIIFFGLGVIIFIRKLADNKPGLIIDDLGLSDNSSGVSGGQILWSEILNISVLKVNSQKFVMLQVKNPEDYINRQTSAFKKKMMEVNFKMYGSPLSITSNGLKISFNDLHKLLVDSYDAAKQREEKSPNC
ncbi:MAG: STM3941 family protein [Bacteroidota bacterium]